MTRYMTRVELSGSPAAKDYEKLHATMEAKGFTRTIKSGEGKLYKLPHAMYYKESLQTIDQVRDLAKQAADGVWAKFSVITSEAPLSSWSGLELA